MAKDGLLPNSGARACAGGINNGNYGLIKKKKVKNDGKHSS